MAQETGIQIKAKSINAFLMERRGTIGALVAKHLTPERMVKGFMAVAARNPKLLECTPISVLNCCIIAGELGLEIGRPRGGMHVVPFKGVATPIPDYRGLIDLAYRSGMVLSVEATTVRKNDAFDYQRGTDSFLHHKPAKSDRGEIQGFYAVAHIRDGRPVFEYMDVEEVNEHRAKSPAYQFAAKKGDKDTPWIAHYEAMGKKTAVKGLTNWLPQNPETDLFQKAVELDSRSEAGESINDLFDIEIEAEPAGTRSDSIKDGLEKKTGKGKEKNDPPPPAEADLATSTEEEAEQEVTPYDGTPLKAEMDKAQCIGRLDACESDLELDQAWSEIRIKYTGVAAPADIEAVQDAFVGFKADMNLNEG